jgi:plasmid replication initiation protein
VSKIIAKKKQSKVVQSNKLVEAHYRLNLQEKRFILWLISKINQDDTELKRYEIKVKDFAEMMGFSLTTQYQELQKVTEGLLTKVIKIKGVGVLEQVTWLCYARWEEGVCSVEFHPALKLHLLQLKEQFTQIGFADLLGLSSTYSVRLLELLAQYENIGNRTTTISDIRAWCGINEDEYKLYGHFKSRVINPAKKEINEKTDYIVDYKEIKESRKVDKIHWTIDKKNQLKEFAAKSQPILKNLIEISHKIKEIADFVKVYENEVSGVHYLLNTIDLKTKGDTLIITFDDKFSKSQCQQNITLQHRLNLFFQTKHVEIF